MTSALGNALYAELVKIRRSRAPMLLVIAGLALPAISVLFTLLQQHPEFAARMGMVGTKAGMAAHGADWSGYLSLLGQALSVGGLIIFGLPAIWIFGREGNEGTMKDLLALPTSRRTIVLAKFTVAAMLCIGVTLIVIMAGLAGGWALGLPGAEEAGLDASVVRLFTTSLLLILVTTPFAYAASAGGGYLSAFGTLILALVLAQIVTAVGLGIWFPWGVPALHVGMPGTEGMEPTWGSYLIVIATGFVGILGTIGWWRGHDHVG